MEDYELIRSRRRTLSLEINSNAKLVVRAPLLLSTRKIEQFIAQKRIWILKNKQKIAYRQQEVQPKQFVNGEEFWYLGKKYPLYVSNNSEFPLILDECFVLSQNSFIQAKDIFHKWYNVHAKHEILGRVKTWALFSGLKYNQIKISSATKRWGSCSYNNNLNFSWRLVMAPVQVIDYVAVHELAHTVEKNHSSRFWNKVEEIMPEYQIYRKWIQKNGHLLVL